MSMLLTSIWMAEMDIEKEIKQLLSHGVVAPFGESAARQRDETIFEMAPSRLNSPELAMLNHLPQVVIGLQNDKIIFANDAVSTVFGWSPEEIVGGHPRLFYRSDEEYEVLSRHCRLALESWKTWRQAFPCRSRDGREILCLVSAAMSGDSLQDNMIVSTFEDITSQKQAEEMLRRSHEDLERQVRERTSELSRINEILQGEVLDRKAAEETAKQSKQMLSHVIDFLPDATVAVDLDGKVIVWNKAIEEMTGVKAEDMLGKGDHEYAVPFYGARRPMLIDLVFQPDEEIEKKYALVRKEKDLLIAETDLARARAKKVFLWGKASPIYDHRGNVVGAIESIRSITDRREIEEALRASNERLQMALAAARMGIWEWDLNTNAVIWHGENASLFGIQPEQFGGTAQDVQKTIHPDDRSRSQMALRRVLKDGAPFENTYRVVWPDQSLHWLYSYGNLVQDGRDRPARIVGTTQDITDRIKAQETLRENESRLRLITDNMVDTIGQIDADMHVLYISPSVKRVLGYEPEEVLWRPISEIVHPDDLQEIARTARTAIKAGASSVELVCRCRHSNGDYFWMESQTHIFYDGENRFAGAVFGARNISKRIDMEKSLRASEERLRMIVGNIPLGVSLMREDQTFEYFNPAFSEILGHTLKDLPDQGAWFEKLFPKAPETDQMTAAMKKSLETRTPARQTFTDVVARCRNGEEKTLNVRSVFLDDGGHLVTYTDRTERRKLEAQLRQAQKMEAVGTLAGGIAHDFNNLLQAILGYSDLLLLRTEKEDPSYREIQQIFRSARRGADLVKQLLTFSRGIESKPRPMDLNQTVTQVGKLLDRTLPKMIAIDLRLDEGLKSIDADPAQMEQILMNLAVNARDAMPDGGRLTIKTENVTLGDEYRRSHVGAPHGEYVLLTVADTGHGMDRQTLDHVFEPFYTTKEVGRGTGLGLSMVYGIVEGHGGHIQCASEPGRGAVFEIYLPAIESAGTNGEESATTDLRKGAGTILLIDDEEPIRDFVRDMLSQFGYRVMTAKAAESGISLYESLWENIDVVILDLIMPGMSGKDCYGELLRINPDARIILASGHHLEDAAREAMGAIAVDLVTKPYDVETMLKAIRKAMKKD